MTIEVADAIEIPSDTPGTPKTPSTLGELISSLEAYPDHALTFRTDEGDIGSGYHVTELKQANIKSIDCGGRTDQWNETVLQLLDGSGGTHMTAGKFVAIARKSESVLPGLSDAPLLIEYAPRNESLRRMKIIGLGNDDQRIVIMLGDDSAVCKPMLDWQNAMVGDCCSSAPQPRKCC